MKKLFSWFGSDKKNVSPYFQKDEEGRDIYYPWGYAGDCYYLTEKQRFLIKTVNRISYFVFFLIFIVLVYITELIGYPIFGAAIVLINLSLAGFITFFYFFQKRMAKYISEELVGKDNSRWPLVIIYLLLAEVVQALMVYAGSTVDHSDPFLNISIVLVVIIYPTLIWFIWRRQGYIFQKKPPAAEESR